MCMRLHPDIIVAAEINNALQIAECCSVRKEDCSMHMSIDEFLSRQKDYQSFGFSNVFVGYDGSEWDENDYRRYFDSRPQYFRPVDNGYDVQLNFLLEGKEGNAAVGQICQKLFTESYPPKILRALGLAEQLA